jgi:hypothetical protein
MLATKPPVMSFTGRLRDIYRLFPLEVTKIKQHNGAAFNLEITRCKLARDSNQGHLKHDPGILLQSSRTHCNKSVLHESTLHKLRV